MLTGVRTHRSHESGQVIALFAVLIPVIFALGALEMDVGNWYVHKRHLQTQVDAAALAGGGSFIGCFLNPDDPITGANDQIKSYALAYAGDTRRDPNTVNLQFQQPNDVYAAINSSGYWSTAIDPSQPPTTGYSLDYTMPPVDSDGITQANSKPCSVKALDVKATDDQAPRLWGLIPLTASPKAHARVEVYKTQGLSGFLPFAVPENDPRSVFALFVDESATDPVNGNGLSATKLNRPAGATIVNGEPGNVWTTGAPNSPAGAQFDMTGIEEAGLIIMQSRRDLQTSDLAGLRLSEICNATTGLMAGNSCFGNIKSGSNHVATSRTGVGFVFGESGTPGPNTATVRYAELADIDVIGGLFGPGNPSCLSTDATTSPYFMWNGDCQVRIRAQIDFGGNLPTNGREVRVQINGPFGNNCNGGNSQLTKQAGNWWESQWITIPAGSGRNAFYLCWKAGPNDGNFNQRVIQMAFASSTDASLSNTVYSGPMVSAQVLPLHSANKGPNTFQVSIGLQPPLQVTDGSAKPVMLRIAGTGSLNQLLDCDPSPRQPVDEIYEGCATPYQVNTRGLQCTGPNPTDPTWDQNNLPPTLPPSDPNWIDPDCIEANPGDVTSMAKGLRQRWENTSTDTPPGAGCPDNKWKEYRASNKVPTDADKRYITLVIANYAAFERNGITVIPITKFAGFYATGWFVGGGTQGTQGCPGLAPAVANDLPPTCPTWPNDTPGDSRCDPSSNRLQGAVWGYFITQVFPTSFGRPSKDSCVFSELGTCIATLVE